MIVKDYIKWLREPFMKQIQFNNKEPSFIILKDGKNVYSLHTNDGLKALNAEIKHLIYDKNDETKITIII